jgi:hypothetical protein
MNTPRTRIREVLLSTVIVSITTIMLPLTLLALQISKMSDRPVGAGDFLLVVLRLASEILSSAGVLTKCAIASLGTSSGISETQFVGLSR